MFFSTLYEHLTQTTLTPPHTPCLPALTFALPEGCEYAMNQLAESQPRFQSGHKGGIKQR